MIEENTERHPSRWRAVGVVLLFVVIGIAVGLGLGMAFSKPAPGRTAAPTTTAAQDGTAMQRAVVEVRIAEWRGEMSAISGGVEDPDVEGRLKPLEIALVQVEKDRMTLDAAAGTAADKSERYDGLEHREELLRLSYDGELGRLKPAQRGPAQRGFLQEEIVGAQDFLERMGAAAPVVKKEEEPQVPVTKSKWIGGTAGGVVGGLLGLAVVLMTGRRKRTVEVVEAPVEAEVEIPELGSIPRMTVLDEVEDSAVAKAALEVGQAMLGEDWGKGLRSYAVTGDDTTGVTAQVGLALSRIGLKVVLVDAGGSGLHEMFAVENEFGVGDWAETEPLTPLVHVTRFAGLAVVPRGSGEVAREKMHGLLARLVGEWDLMLVDAPELGAGFEGGVVLVVRGGDGMYERGGAALGRLVEDGLRVTGVVVS